jgi:hypothetical protein
MKINGNKIRTRRRLCAAMRPLLPRSCIIPYACKSLALFRVQSSASFKLFIFILCSASPACKKQKMKSFSFCVGVECSGTSIVPPHGLWSECSGWSACIILPCLIFQGPIVLLRGRHHSSIVVVIANSLALSGVALLKVCTENFAAAATTAAVGKNVIEACELNQRL